MTSIHDQLLASYPPFARWRNVPIQKNPFDLLLYQEAIMDTLPLGVVEIGSMHGGSAMFFADMLTLAWFGKNPPCNLSVLSVDITPRDYPDDPRLTFLNADSVSDDAIHEIDKFCEYHHDRVMVVLDGDHTYEHVLLELDALNRFVAEGQFLVVEDASHTGAGKACDEWDASGHKFERVDQSRYLCTYNVWYRW